MDDCIFCKIISGEIGAFVIDDSQYYISMLDISPKAKGHTMVIPKRHSETILDLNDDELINIGVNIKNTVNLIAKSVNPDGFTIGINHGKVAGQAVNHLHVHIIPRFAGDKGGSIHSVVSSVVDESVEETYKNIMLIKNKV